MRDLQHKHEMELQTKTDAHSAEASEIQDRLDDHDDLARIIHEVKAEAGEEESGKSAEQVSVHCPSCPLSTLSIVYIVHRVDT